MSTKVVSHLSPNAGFRREGAARRWRAILAGPSANPGVAGSNGFASPENLLRPGASTSRCRGFTLIEIIVGLGLFAVLVAGAISVLGMAVRVFAPRSVTIAGSNVAIAPDPGAFSDAVRLHSVLLEHLAGARAVYTFGGIQEGLAGNASRNRVNPLAADCLPIVNDFSRGLPQDSLALHERYGSELGPFAGNTSPEDFSVVVIGPSQGHLAVTALVQVRREEVAQGERFVRRRAVLFDVSGLVYRYEFLEKPAVASVVKVGARHFWYRYAEGRVAEEGPVLALFPDPSILGGSRGGVTYETPPFSRFAYFLSCNL